MINPNAKLVENLGDKTKLKMKATRDGYGTGLVAAGEKDERVVVLCADLTESTKSLGFKDKFPERFIELGVAEQNMATVAAGMANAAQMDGKSFRTYCFMSDGEHDSGNLWESVLFVGKYKLHNITSLIDRNNIQIDGMTEDIMPLENLRAKYEAFNWHVLEVDGHNFEEIVDAVEQAKAIYEKPTVIIAHTIPGKGIPEIEFDYKWHGVPPNKDQAQKFLTELRTLQGRIESEHE